MEIRTYPILNIFIVSAAEAIRSPRYPGANKAWRSSCSPMRSPEKNMGSESLIEKTWVTLEFGNHQYDPVQGYDQVVNIVTTVILGPNEPGYDHEKFHALMEEIKPYLRRYDKAKVISKEGQRID